MAPISRHHFFLSTPLKPATEYADSLVQVVLT